MLTDRYAYFKKLTYFSTECIYSPDGMWPSSVPLTMFLRHCEGFDLI